MKIWYWILDTLYQIKIRILTFTKLPEYFDRPIVDKNALVVVMVQGIGSKVVAGRPLAKFIVDSGLPVITIPELGSNICTIPRGAKIVADKVQSLELKNVVLICGSKGALIGKYIL